MATDWKPSDMTYDPDEYEIDLYVLGIKVEKTLDKAMKALKEASDARAVDATFAINEVVLDLAGLHGWLAGLGICRRKE